MGWALPWKRDAPGRHGSFSVDGGGNNSVDFTVFATTAQSLTTRKETIKGSPGGGITEIHAFVYVPLLWLMRIL